MSFADVGRTTVSAGESLAPAYRALSRVSWGAILAGAFIAVAVGLMLNVLGTGVAGMMVNASARATPDASSFGIGGAIWFVVSNLIGLAIGGYVAARLSGAADEMDATLHGVVVWAAAFLVSAMLLGNLISGIGATAVSGASSILGGAANGAGSAAAAAANTAVANPAATDALVSRMTSALNTGGDVATMTPDQRKAEIAVLVGRRVTDGTLATADYDRLVSLVAADAGISPQEAQARIDQADQQSRAAMQQAEEMARKAADAAAGGAALAAFGVFLTMLLGMIAAVVGARRGWNAHRVHYARSTT